MSHEIRKGVPYINGKRAKFDKEPSLLPEAFSQWRCPECKAHLSARLQICLNACHLTERQQRDFAAQMSAVTRKT